MMTNSKSLNIIPKKSSCSAFYFLVKDAIEILLSIPSENSIWFRKIHAKTWNIHPGGEPSIAALLTTTENGNKLLKKFPDLRNKIIPKDKTKLKRHTEIPVIEIDPDATQPAGKRQKIDLNASGMKFFSVVDGGGSGQEQVMEIGKRSSISP